jgi:hypothetical protein
MKEPHFSRYAFASSAFGPYSRPLVSPPNSRRTGELDLAASFGHSGKVPGIPPLKSLHPDSSLSKAKLERLKQTPTGVLVASLRPGLRDCLKVRPDGTILDGHHRIRVLRDRQVDVNELPRTVIHKKGMDSDGEPGRKR